MPCTARATLSITALPAAAQAREARVKSQKPARNTRREPNLSPSTPAESRNTAKPRV